MDRSFDAKKRSKKLTMSLTSKKVSPDKNKDLEGNRNKPTTCEPGKTGSKKSGKLKRSLNDLLVEMTATDEELEYRKSKLIEDDVVERSLKFFRCTKCHKSYKETMNDGKPVQIHPFLGVLMCENCCDYYGDGNFSLDSDGEDKYCRWCGEGGTILTCSKCIYGFCATCIKKHFGVERLKEVKKDDDWLCFFCNPKPLWELRFICSLAEQVSETQDADVLTSNEKETSQSSSIVDVKNGNTKADPVSCGNSNKKVSSNEESSLSQEEIPSILKNSQSSRGSQTPNSHAVKNTKSSILQNRKRVEELRSYMYISSSDEADEDQRETPKKRVRLSFQPTLDTSFTTLRTQVVEKLKKILKLAEYQTTFATNWSNKTFTKLLNENCLNSKEELVKECQKIKWFLSMLSSHLVEFCNSVETIEKFLSSGKCDISGFLLPEQVTPVAATVDRMSGKDSKSVKKDIRQMPSDESPYTSVLLFLNFISNQVKTFVDKGISFQDVLEAEVYNDPNVLGIKKKAFINSGSNSSSKSEKNKERKKAGKRKNLISSDSETEVSESEKVIRTPEQVKLYLKNSTKKDDVSEILAILENA